MVIQTKGDTMDLHSTSTPTGLRARLEALRGSGGRLRAASFTPPSIVSALRMLLYLYPPEYRRDRALQERVLRAFVLTVIPGADPAEPDLVRMYYDEHYPFFPYTGYLVYALERRGKRQGGFVRLTPAGRTQAVLGALASDDTTSRLFKGAILMAQVSYFAGIYHPERGCPLIEFPGKNGGFTPEELSLPGAGEYLGAGTTPDGNPP